MCEYVIIFTSDSDFIGTGFSSKEFFITNKPSYITLTTLNVGVPRAAPTAVVLVLRHWCLLNLCVSGFSYFDFVIVFHFHACSTIST